MEELDTTSPPVKEPSALEQIDLSDRLLDWRRDSRLEQLEARLTEFEHLAADAHTTWNSASIDADKIALDLDDVRVEIFAGQGDQAVADELAVKLRNARQVMQEAQQARETALHDAALVQRSMAPLLTQAKERAAQRFREVYPELVQSFIASMTGAHAQSPILLYQAITECHERARAQFSTYEQGCPEAAGLQRYWWPKGDLLEAWPLWLDDASGARAERHRTMLAEVNARSAAEEERKAQQRANVWHRAHPELRGQAAAGDAEAMEDGPRISVLSR